MAPRLPESLRTLFRDGGLFDQEKMKIALNLAALPSRRERYALAWAVPLSMAAALGMVILVFAGWRNVREYREARRSALEIEQRELDLQKQTEELRKGLDHPQFLHLIRETQFVNGLINRKQLSMTELTLKVSKLLPLTVRLNGLAFARQGNDPEVRISVVGRSVEALESFLTNLEESPDFRDAEIVNQSFEKEGTASGGTSAVYSARYVGGTPR